ncbi:lysine--tRNA ligase [Orbaceae bacterium ESL0727]|nr:lysine--tRNA ligase [Orbaceae bacterium ESL0727]
MSTEQQDNHNQQSQLEELNNELKTRREKLVQIREQGIAFPNDFRRDAISQSLHQQYDDKTNEELIEHKIIVTVAGRMMMRRIMGKASFASLQDVGGQIQLYVTRDDLPEGVYNEQFKKWDLGDIIGAKGYLFKTKTGELSIHCQEVRLLTKALRPLPDKFHGLADQEMRYRQRYLDLITNQQSRNTFRARSQIVTEIRNFMLEHHFMEVETPMMHVIPGGASAKPFITHHNALDIDMYLRIAPELYLKRLVVGGFERVFEINRNFRNEGVSPRHNPEFTMMEMYMAYADYKDLIVLVENLFRRLAINVTGNPVVQYGDNTFDFGKPFAKMTMREAICHYRPETNNADLDDFDKACAIAKSIGIQLEKGWGLGRVVTEIFEEVVEANLIQPTFITEYPAEVSPLARRNDKNPAVTDRFEFFIGGREIGNGFSELNDAEDQAQRFADQVKQKDAGDDEAMFYDEDYIIALEHGLPPTAGLGIGIDRTVMLFTNSHTIRDVILFPAMRPNK